MSLLVRDKILISANPILMLKLKTHSGFHDLFLKYTARGRFCVTQTLLTNSVTRLFFQRFFNPSTPFKSYCYYVQYICMVFCLILMLAYILCFPPSLRGKFCNTKFVYDFVVFSFECHLIYQWKFSSNIWILSLRHLMNKWQVSFILNPKCKWYSRGH